MKRLHKYFGMTPFTVSVDDSPELRNLASQARDFRSFPFAQKLEKISDLATGAMENAYEGMITGQNPLHREIVCNSNLPLSFALQNKAGCCRYQGALFFVLGYEAELGDRHFIQAAPVKPGLNSVFNEVYEGKNRHIVSIFLRSLKDKGLDYSVENPHVFEQAFLSLPGFNFYSYHQLGRNNLFMVENPEKHITEIKH